VATPSLETGPACSPAIESDAVVARKSQPLWPMTHRSAASYSHSVIATQPKTSRKAAFLTPAEARVLTLLATYRTLAAIGEELGIGRPTVKTHVQHIYKKLGANTRAQAVKRAEYAGWIPAREEQP
jgi:DNA-binding CsgD family transcriptional regulator